MVYGYQFGRGNHAVYLLDALRRVDPSLLQRDWFTTQTFQYHVIFSSFSAWLMRLGIVEPAFAACYLLLILLMHIAWRRIVRHLGGGDETYLLSVVLYYISAAGTGLGMYQFLQDSSLLPSNIANVAMLWAIYLWIAGRPGWSGVCFGIAGIFHLNHALVGVGMWGLLCAWDKMQKPQAQTRGGLALGTLGAILPSAINIAIAARLKLSANASMPLDQFVDLYARLRHPHHYDPSSWPAMLWIAALWPAVPAVIVLRGPARRIIVIFLALILVALLGAGAWFISETLVQMSLFRFSIYVQLLGCIAAAVWFARRPNRKRLAAALGASGCAAIFAICAARGPFFGAFTMPRDDPDYLAMCRWAARNTPVDAIFIVPPDEESMRLVGRRAIVVNFKGVPQLSGEMLEWRDRLCAVLDLPNLSGLPHGFAATRQAIRSRYDQLTLEQFQAVANKYGARYMIASHPLASPANANSSSLPPSSGTPGQGRGGEKSKDEAEQTADSSFIIHHSSFPSLRIIPTGETGRYFLYDLSR